MRLRWIDALLALALAALVPGAAQAEDESLRSEMDEMRQMILHLQDTVSAQAGQIDQQRQVIDRAGIEEVTLGDGSSSRIASFFENVDMTGWVAVSYFHNLNDLDTRDLVGGNTGGAGIFMPFHPDDNSFSFDQLWFEIGKAATSDDRAGFFAEIAYGRTAGLLPLSNAGVGGGNDLYINSAYVEYLATLMGKDVLFKLGKFGTLIGAEVAQAPYNWNITRGNVYNLFQPIDHTGFLMAMDLGRGFSTTLGVVNNPNSFGFGSGSQPDANDGKAFLGQLAYSAESWSVSLNGTYGADTAGTDEPKLGIIDLVASWDPTDKLSFWLNADLVLRDDDAFRDDPNAWGVALAGRYGWTERTGTAVRIEFADDDGQVFGCSGDQPASNTETECQIWGVTLTQDYALTNNLTVKAELRYDAADLHDNSDDVFFDNDTGRRRTGAFSPARGDDQLLFGLEAIYQF